MPKFPLNENYLKWFLNNTRALITIIDQEGGIIFANATSLKKLLGYTPEEILHKKIQDFIHPTDQPRLLKQMQLILQGEEDELVTYYSCRCKDGSWAHLESTPKLMLNSKGEKEVIVITRDVTPQKQLEKDWKNLFNNSLDGIYRTSTKGRFILANQALVEMLGYNSVEELLAINIHEDLYDTPEDREDWMEQIELAGQLKNIEMNLKRKDGSIITALDNCVPVRDENNNIKYYEGILTDITLRKKAMSQLQNSQANLQAILENSNDCICSLNINFEITITNQKFADLMYLLYGKHIFNKTKFLEYLPTSKQKQWQEWLEKAINGENFYVNLTESISGITQYFEISFNPINNPKTNSICGISIFLSDITRQKQSHHELWESRERYRLLIDNSPVGIISIDNHGNIQEINHQISKILGLDHQNAKKINIFNYQPFINAKITTDIRSAITQDKNTISEKLFTNSKGKQLSIHYNFIPIKTQDSNTTIIQGVIEDVTDRRKASDQLFESYKYLGVINRKLSILLSVSKQQQHKDDNEVINYLLSSARELSHAPYIFVYKYNKSLHRIKLVAQQGSNAHQAPKIFNALAIDDSKFLSRLTNQNSRSQSNRLDPHLQPFRTELNITNILGLPLIQDQHLYGHLIFGFTNNKELTTQELDFYEVFAMQAAYTLSNTSIFSK